MTADDTITFPCPACGSQLAIPKELAGIVGPCPACNTNIRAPYPEPVPVATTAPPEPSYQAPQTPYGPPQPQHQPVSTSYQVPPAPQQPSYPSETAPVYPPITPPIEAVPTQPIGTSYKPEPRQLPSRSNPLEHVSKQIPDNRDPAVITAPYSRQRHRGKLFRMMLPLCFLAITAIIIGGLVFLLKKKTDEPALKKPIAPARPILDDETSSTTPAPAPPVKPAVAPVIEEPPAAGLTAIKVLEKFLTATKLQERLPLMETKTPETELAASLLAKPLPTVARIDTDFQETNGVEKVTDVFYNVDFQGEDGKINPQTILVRIRGDASPKVVVDPLLDSMGGRLEAYAKKPSDKPAIFQVLIFAGSYCYEESVPNREKKYTLKLLPRDNSKEIARAYFGKFSRIGEMLEDNLSGLNFGQAKACTVMLHWNTEEDAAKPYLEAISLKSLDWNP